MVGAGLAGLATAYELSRRGCEVTVLEAATGPGGRAYTLRQPFADGMHVEAGAMTITPHCHYVHHYAASWAWRWTSPTSWTASSPTSCAAASSDRTGTPSPAATCR
ncbi:FAD-dependent oxidoreductase [Kutzneria kofuensis]|uniref:FAD-dependent oxidoreductase n=1 Tax=Kutzneria kofuensis TaxID=103725 RepID=UPI00337446C9